MSPRRAGKRKPRGSIAHRASSSRCRSPVNRRGRDHAEEQVAHWSRSLASLLSAKQDRGRPAAHRGVMTASRPNCLAGLVTAAAAGAAMWRSGGWLGGRQRPAWRRSEAGGGPCVPEAEVGGRGRRRRGGPCRARRRTLAGGPCPCPTLKKSAWTVQQAGHVVADPPNSVCGQVFRYFSGLERETGPTVHAEPSGWISRQLLYHCFLLHTQHCLPRRAHGVVAHTSVL